MVHNFWFCGLILLSSARGIIAWMEQNQQRWICADKQIWRVKSDDDVIFTFSVIYQFSRRWWQKSDTSLLQWLSKNTNSVCLRKSWILGLRKMPLCSHKFKQYLSVSGCRFWFFRILHFILQISSCKGFKLLMMFLYYRVTSLIN